MSNETIDTIVFRKKTKTNSVNHFICYSAQKNAREREMDGNC